MRPSGWNLRDKRGELRVCDELDFVDVDVVDVNDFDVELVRRGVVEMVS